MKVFVGCLLIMAVLLSACITINVPPAVSGATATGTSPQAPPPVVSRPAPAPPAGVASEQILRAAKITFSLPQGDDKDDNTKISVTVTTRVNNQWDRTIASLENFADQTVWEDDGNHSYSYDLKVSGTTRLSVVESRGVKTRIDWAPVGNDRGFFNYRLVLTFDDNDPATPAEELVQTNPALIEMSEKITTYTNP